MNRIAAATLAGALVLGVLESVAGVMAPSISPDDRQGYARSPAPDPASRWVNEQDAQAPRTPATPGDEGSLDR